MTVTTTREVKDLEQILSLQRANLIKGLSTAEWQDQGFVTVEHTLDVLQRMHDTAPSIIIKDNDRVIAYALAMPRECGRMVPVLVPMFENLEKLYWKDKPLNQQRFYVMGQICIDKAYRGRGLFDALYQKHKEVYSDRFDLLVTEIATRNTRSLRAHERVGFKTVNIYRDETDEWAVVIWDWA
ncbi:MAG TPA: GNAT family N-acetyltransferase [Chitinophagaceae bacterium]|nr:GNAT family N-acetyltransferase [Chitinophagaceae bacterium]